ncbi:MAG: hypothetical protein F6K22_21605 [Okeania sp. SIO2F4]|uniref:hypothetical protein n=1 Tax=Okeania sp. SIO2F4 TaxID=2607790 RepID=UPI00142A29B8|nr:hypothetical protein [Okeania sp. SIO2F4]NES05185.1 hypothetical protein [Okeania sp. SIO2F4]
MFYNNSLEGLGQTLARNYRSLMIYAIAETTQWPCNIEIFYRWPIKLLTWSSDR